MFTKKVMPKEEQIVAPVAPKVQPPKEQPEEEEQEESEEARKELTEEDIIKALTEERNLLLNHEARISAIESALFRIKALG